MIKSKMNYSKNTSKEDMDLFSSILGIKSSANFGKYLRFPIFHKRPTHGDFQFIIDSIKSKLTGWKTRFLNMAGRTTLAKASIASIPSHVMQFIKLHISTCNKINKTPKGFYLGYYNRERENAHAQMGYHH